MLDVYLFDSKVGWLAADRGRLEFTYTDDAIGDSDLVQSKLRDLRRDGPRSQEHSEADSKTAYSRPGATSCLWGIIVH